MDAERATLLTTAKEKGSDVNLIEADKIDSGVEASNHPWIQAKSRFAMIAQLEDDVEKIVQIQSRMAGIQVQRDRLLAAGGNIYVPDPKAQNMKVLRKAVVEAEDKEVWYDAQTELEQCEDDMTKLCSDEMLLE